MTQNIKAALIDMDGTLYDSMPSHARAWQQMTHEIGIDVPFHEFFLYEGRTGASTINILFNRAFRRDATTDEIAKLYHRKTQLFSAMPPVRPMQGADRMLQTLLSNNIERILVTGSGQNSLIDRLQHDFPGIFSPQLMITGHDVTLGKPDPEPYLKAMNLLNLKPENCIVIENAPLGVESGHRSGAYTIGVNTGPIPSEALSNAGADIIFSSMNEFADHLPTLLKKLNDIKN